MQFKDQDSKRFWDDPDNYSSKRIAPDVRKALYTKLQILDAAHSINDLRVPPGNRLEKLKGNRSDQWSIRVNQQWRLCFVWKENEAKEVEFDDYH